MSKQFDLVKQYITELELLTVAEEPEEELIVVESEEDGIKNLVIDCEYPILIMEQAIMPVPRDPGDLFQRLLQMNRGLVHGAFVLDGDAKLILFRDTLQLEHLDRNEFEGSIRALSLALAEHSRELLKYNR